MSISFEVVDGVFGVPAEGVKVTLWRWVDAEWREEAGGRTDNTGRLTDLVPVRCRSRYRLTLASTTTSRRWG
jgi:5-hydroxyisourate hydrolase-like protein (transthyretin family)